MFKISLHNLMKFLVLTSIIALNMTSVSASDKAKSDTPEIMYIIGNISGIVNDRYVDFGLNIKLNMDTGEETAQVNNMDEEMGAIMRQVTAMVTIGGPTGGQTTHELENLFELSNGNYINSASMYWPRTKDRLELIHTVTYEGGDTMNVKATINGSVPIISAEHAVEYRDFSETLYWEDCKDCNKNKAQSGSQTKEMTTGVGFRGDFGSAHAFRSYLVDGVDFGGGTGKGSKTTFVSSNDVSASGPIVRIARDITSTYDPRTHTMHVHLFNSLMPLEAYKKR